MTLAFIIFMVWMIGISIWAFSGTSVTKQVVGLSNDFWKGLSKTKEPERVSFATDKIVYTLEHDMMRLWEIRFASDGDFELGSGLNEMIEGYAKGKVSMNDLKEAAIFHVDDADFIKIKIRAEEAANVEALLQSTQPSKFDNDFLLAAKNGTYDENKAIKAFLDGNMDAKVFTEVVKTARKNAATPISATEHRKRKDAARADIRMSIDDYEEMPYRTTKGGAKVTKAVRRNEDGTLEATIIDVH